LEHLGSRTLRLGPLLLGGLAAQLLSSQAAGGRSTVLLVASYTLLLAFAAANVVVVGMWLVAGGIALNLAVIAANGGMPVRESALRAAGVLEPGTTVALDSASKHHLERPSDRLVVLGDIIPAKPLREVVSFGDVVMAVGVADVVAHLLRPRAGGRTRPQGDPDDDRCRGESVGASG